MLIIVIQPEFHIVLVTKKDEKIFGTFVEDEIERIKDEEGKWVYGEDMAEGGRYMLIADATVSRGKKFFKKNDVYVFYTPDMRRDMHKLENWDSVHWWLTVIDEVMFGGRGNEFSRLKRKIKILSSENAGLNKDVDYLLDFIEKGGLRASIKKDSKAKIMLKRIEKKQAKKESASSSKDVSIGLGDEDEI